MDAISFEPFLTELLSPELVRSENLDFGIWLKPTPKRCLEKKKSKNDNLHTWDDSGIRKENKHGIGLERDIK